MAVSVKNEAFLDLEFMLRSKLDKAWSRHVNPIIRDITKAVGSGEFGEAHRLVDTIDMGPVIESKLRLVKTVAMSSLLLGASRLVPQRDSQAFQDPNEVFLTNAEAQLVSMLKENATLAIRRDAHLVVAVEESSKVESRLVFKADFSHALRVSIDVNGKGFIGIGSSMMTSRMSSAGFLQEAVAQGIQHYSVSEVIDRRTCPVCEIMNGQIFPVVVGINHIGTVMGVDNAEGLRSVAPWPSQSATNVTRLGNMDSGQLASAGLSMPPYHPLCYSDQVRVYTKRGFIPFNLVNIETDKFLSLNPDDGSLEWVLAVDKQEYQFSGNMLRMGNGNNSVRMTVTSEHSQYVSRRVDTGKGGRVFKGKFLPVNEAFISPENWLYLSSEHKGNESVSCLVAGNCYETSYFMAFLGYYLSEGSTRKRGGHYESTISQCNHMEIMKAGVEACGISHYVSGDKIYLTESALNEWLYQFGHSYEKFIPDFVFDLAPRYIDLFLEAYILGDGTERKRDCFGYHAVSHTIVTSSIRMRDQLVELAIRANKAANFHLMSRSGTKTKHHNGVYASNHDCWVITIRNTKRQKPKIKMVPYTGLVHDVTLEKFHTLLVEEGGRVCWSGNCRGIIVKEGDVVSIAPIVPLDVFGLAVSGAIAANKLSPEQLMDKLFGSTEDMIEQAIAIFGEEEAAAMFGIISEEEETSPDF